MAQRTGPDLSIRFGLLSQLSMDTMTRMNNNEHFRGSKVEAFQDVHYKLRSWGLDHGITEGRLDHRLAGNPDTTRFIKTIFQAITQCLASETRSHTNATERASSFASSVSGIAASQMRANDQTQRENSDSLANEGAVTQDMERITAMTKSYGAFVDILRDLLLEVEEPARPQEMDDLYINNIGHDIGQAWHPHATTDEIFSTPSRPPFDTNASQEMVPLPERTSGEIPRGPGASSQESLENPLTMDYRGIKPGYLQSQPHTDSVDRHRLANPMPHTRGKSSDAAVSLTETFNSVPEEPSTRRRLRANSRPHKCSERSCKYHQEGFPTRSDLRRHFNSKHLQTSGFHCSSERCNASFKLWRRLDHLRHHMKTQHPNENLDLLIQKAKAEKVTPAANDQFNPDADLIWTDFDPLHVPGNYYPHSLD